MIPKRGARFSETIMRKKSQMTFSLGPRAAAAGYRLAAFDQIGSTNAEAMLRARAGEARPDLVRDVGGRRPAADGGFGPWVAPRGNLASSILEVIDVAPAAAATLGFRGGACALESALRKLSVEAALRMGRLGWPEFLAEMAKRTCWPDGASLPASCWKAEAMVGGSLAVVVGTGTKRHCGARWARRRRRLR